MSKNDHLNVPFDIFVRQSEKHNVLNLNIIKKQDSGPFRKKKVEMGGETECKRKERETYHISYQRPWRTPTARVSPCHSAASSERPPRGGASARGSARSEGWHCSIYIQLEYTHTHTHKYIVSGIKCTYSHRVCLASEDFGYVVPGCALVVGWPEIQLVQLDECLRIL